MSRLTDLCLLATDVFIDRLEDVITRSLYVCCRFVVQAEVEMAVKPAAPTIFLMDIFLFASPLSEYELLQALTLW
ncbi:MAG: hypothetical protein M3O33_14925 [Cyanobacteriota bacterium]|nr:hypothetical protein [Cyanobacteriota bacterium]